MSDIVYPLFIVAEIASFIARDAPLIFGFLFGRRSDVHQHDVHADLFDAFQIDIQLRSSPAKPLSSGHDNALHSPFGIGKDDVADLSELFSVRKIDRFFAVQFAKARFHTPIVCSAAQKCACPVFSGKFQGTWRNFPAFRVAMLLFTL